MYFLIPETENRTLEDIELHFSDNNRKITDIKIAKNRPIHVKSNQIENGQIQSTKEIIVGCDNRAFAANESESTNAKY